MGHLNKVLPQPLFLLAPSVVMIITFNYENNYFVRKRIQISHHRPMFRPGTLCCVLRQCHTLPLQQVCNQGGKSYFSDVKITKTMSLEEFIIERIFLVKAFSRC